MISKKVEEAIKEGKDYIEFMTTAGDNAEWAETVLSYIEELEKEVEKYMKLSASSLARELNESIRANEKNKTELELLNEGWKQVIRDKIKELEENGYWEFLEQRDLEKTISILKSIIGE